MKDTRTVWRSFIPWQYNAEAAEMDGMSEQGWQLKSLGLHKRTYVRDDSIRYRYAMDLQKEEPRPDYFELFWDQGWERVCACRNSDGSGAAGEFTLTDSRGRAVAGGTLAEDRPMGENEHEVFLWPGRYTLTTGAGPEAAAGGIIYSLRSGWDHSLFR